MIQFSQKSYTKESKVFKNVEEVLHWAVKTVRELEKQPWKTCLGEAYKFLPLPSMAQANFLEKLNEAANKLTEKHGRCFYALGKRIQRFEKGKNLGFGLCLHGLKEESDEDALRQSYSKVITNVTTLWYEEKYKNFRKIRYPRSEEEYVLFAKKRVDRKLVKLFATILGLKSFVFCHDFLCDTMIQSPYLWVKKEKQAEVEKHFQLVRLGDSNWQNGKLV